jgi:hypothetical protein
MIVGSMAMLPPIMTGTRIRANNTVPRDACELLGKRPRLNLSKRAASGNKAMTESHTTENLSKNKK